MSKYNIIVSDHDFDNLLIERQTLKDIGEVRDASTDEDIDSQLIGADAIINLRYPIGEDLIGRLKTCQVISRYGIGVDNIAVKAATDCGIPVTNVPEYCIEEVSIHALSLLLSLIRGVKSYDASIAHGGWDREVAIPIHRFSSLTVGIVGFGAIGRMIAHHIDALGAAVITSDPFIDQQTASAHNATVVGFNELLERADAVTIHSPLTDTTCGMFGTDAFARMRDSAVLVNVARGPIIDHEALRVALDTNEIAGAGLDVFPNEPPKKDDSLCNHENVLTTPHVAWYSEEANTERRHEAARNVRMELLDQQSNNVVNDV
jgi:D-3-phosphoglycerate dehydrogenase